MAVKLSREAGGFSIVLARTQWLDPALIAPGMSATLRLPRSDTVRACRLQRGILFEGATQASADSVVAQLKAHEVEALTVPDSALPLMPKPLSVFLAGISASGLETPSVQGAGLPRVWPWDDLALVAAGITLDPAQQTAGVVDKMDRAALADATDRQAVAQHTLERARTRVFPLADELRRGEPEVGEALQAAMTGGKAPAQVALGGFGMIGTVIDFVFTRPFERLRVTDKTRVPGIPRSAYAARNLHCAVKEVEAQADSATMAGATLALATGADSGEYLFEDLAQFDDYCRWAYYWRLRHRNGHG